ncbi:MAG: hypothetical protein IKK09_02165 [Clostridia bacterium]|nr:hypothetical protein [Clostridia bacterium]
MKKGVKAVCTFGPNISNHKGCDKKSVRKDWIEDLVIKQIESVLFNDRIINKLADDIMTLQGKENTVLPLLRKKQEKVQRSIDNIIKAIEEGIFTSSTKERLEALENEKKEIAVQIAKEEMEKPLLEKNQIVFWFHRLRKYNVNRLEHRRRLIDSFINSVYLYDDRMVIFFNYKDGSKTVGLNEVKKSDMSSDSTSCALPKNQTLTNGSV